MPWLLSEYVLKGLFLGLLFFVALKALPDWRTTGEVAAFALGGLAVALVAAAGRKIREGYRVGGRLAAFVLFLLLENSGLVYAGIIVGMALGAYAVEPPGEDRWLLGCVGGGAALGVVFWLLRRVAQRAVRLVLSLLLAAGLVAGALYAYEAFGEHVRNDPAWATTFGVRLLLGIPLFYLLTFAGIAEESEIETGAVCAALGLGAFALVRDYPSYQSFALFLPVLLYFFYTTRVLPGLRVLKHVVRGISFAKIGRFRPALQSFRRALQLDPGHGLARESMWALHRSLDLESIAGDTETLALLDLDLCLERATALLLEPRPSAERLHEAQRLLTLVLNQRPAQAPVVQYWRAVAYTHARRLDEAAAELEHVLDPATAPPGDPARESVLLSAWQLALLLHTELNRRVGTPQLAQPGRRMDAIGAVERRLTASPEDAAAWDLKRLLYGGVTEAEYRDATGGERPAADFDHSYAQQLGLALVNDPARWRRGVEYLRVAARGLPAQAPSIFLQLAELLRQHGDVEAAVGYYELAKRAGKAVGAKGLGDAERQAYFTAVKTLAEDARARGDVDAAIENYHLYTESTRSGLETLRILADLYEQKKDVLGGLRVVEQALLYNPKDKDLLERKDRFYYSIMPDQLRASLDSIRGGFDLAYCLRKSRALLDYRDADLDLVDWGQHLADLALVVKPESVAAKVLKARALRRRGEIDQAQAVLEGVFSPKPESFASAEDEEAWFMACRLLGEMYLYELNRPDLAVPCFTEYRRSSKSGADTMYKLGQAHEQLGDLPRAAKYYKHVAAYESHPLAMDARDALHRIQAG